MNSHILAELAEFQRQELIADATRFRPRKSLRAAPSRVDRPLRRPIVAFRHRPAQVEL